MPLLFSRSTDVSRLRNSGAAAYWAYKAFQAMRVCTGDVTVIAELLAEGLLNEGVADSMRSIVEAIDRTLSLHGGIEEFKRSVKNFAHFSRKLARKFRERGNHCGGDAMESAERIYEKFMKCDLDNSGGVSLDEFVHFCAREGVPREMAEAMFCQADTDGNGQISFEEWTAMMVGRVGRDKNSFNCGGLHGMAEYHVPINGMACNFCGRSIPAGSLALGCRRCDCDACASCAGLGHALPPPLPPREDRSHFDCRGRHGLALFTVPMAGSCNWCHGTVHAGHMAVGCRICNVDACMNCLAAKLASSRAGAITCYGRHGLVSTNAAVQGYACDFCQADIPYLSTFFSCRTCQVDCCVACIWKDHCRARSTGSHFSCPGNHEFRTLHITSHGQLAHKCDWCLGGPSLGGNMLRCGVCNVDLCNACRASGSTRTNCPFRLDSVVRVVGVDDHEIDGNLMTVLGFEPTDRCGGTGGGGIVVLNRAGRIYRIPKICVVKVVD